MFSEKDGLDIKMDVVMLIQHVYELHAFCTSTIIRTKDGRIVLDRNMDFAFTKTMR